MGIQKGFSAADVFEVAMTLMKILKQDCTLANRLSILKSFVFLSNFSFKARVVK